jgi:hypothetical protein
MPACRICLCLGLALLANDGLLAQGISAAPPASIGLGNWLRPAKPLAVSATPHPSVGRIIVQERDGIAFGSGTLIDVNGDQGVVVTNWHVVRDATGDIEVVFPDGFRSKAKVLKMDRDWDLAALVIWKPNAPPVALSPTAPQPGEVLTIAGYGSGNFRAATAKCTQYVSPGHSLPYEMVEVGTEARQGDSGGPILNERGEVAGVLFGAGGGTTSGSYVGRVRTFLATVSPRLSDPAAPPPPENIASTNPFLNPQGAPRLVREANAKAAAPGIEQPIAGDGWHASKRDPAAISADQMQPITPTAPRVETPVAQFASRKTEITFGSLPEQTAPSTASLEHKVNSAPAEDEQFSLWSRPLPSPAPAVTANRNEGQSPAPVVAQATLASPPEEIWQQLLGVTIFDQAKSMLALLGTAAIALRLLRTPAKSDE